MCDLQTLVKLQPLELLARANELQTPIPNAYTLRPLAERHLRLWGMRLNIFERIFKAEPVSSDHLHWLYRHTVSADDVLTYVVGPDGHNLLNVVDRLYFTLKYIDKGWPVPLPDDYLPAPKYWHGNLVTSEAEAYRLGLLNP